MLRKKSPRLAAAFVVTISAGCGGASTQEANGSDRDDVPRTNAVMSQFINNGNGRCYIEIFANPPFQTPVDCETKQPIKTVDQNAPLKVPEPDKPKPPEPPPSDVKPSNVKPSTSASGLTPRPPDDSNLPEAPVGSKVIKNSDGSCRVYEPAPKCPPATRCNPPPPRNVKCPSKSTQDGPDPNML